MRTKTLKEVLAIPKIIQNEDRSFDIEETDNNVSLWIPSDMRNYFGKKCEITEYYQNDENGGYFHIDADNEYYWWTKDMIVGYEPQEEINFEELI